MDTKDLIRMVNGAPLIIKLLESTQGRGRGPGRNQQSSGKRHQRLQVGEDQHPRSGVHQRSQRARHPLLRGKWQGRRGHAAPSREGRIPGEHSPRRSSLPHQDYCEERKLALKATKVLNLAVAGVDIIRSNKGPLLLEVNSSPGLEGIEKATGTDIANTMIQAIERKLKFTV